MGRTTNDRFLLRYNRIRMQVDVQPQPTVSAETRKEFTALTTGCGVFKLGRTHIALTGADRVRWLNGMVTNNIRDLALEHGVYAFLLNPQGKIQADLYAFNRGERIVVEADIPQLETILEIFDRYIIMDEVEIENLNSAVIGLAGAACAEMLQREGFPDAEKMQQLQVSEFQLDGQKLRLIRGDNPCIPTYEVCAGVDETQRVWDSLVKAGAQPIQSEALEIFRIACGIPKFGVDIRPKDLPQETGQDRALNFNKGCYVGQEIVERIRSRGAVHRMFTGFDIEGTVPAVGFRVQQEGKDIAELTSVTTLPTDEAERTVALGYGRKELMLPGKQYVTGETKLRVAALPFLKSA
jgi:folate-binding protein YgfZ